MMTRPSNIAHVNPYAYRSDAMNSLIGVFYPAMKIVDAFEFTIDEDDQRKAIADVLDPEFWRLVFGCEMPTDEPLLRCQRGIVAHVIRSMHGPVLENLFSATVGLSNHRFQWLEVSDRSDGDFDVRCHPIRATTVRQAAKMFSSDPRISLAYSGIMHVSDRRSPPPAPDSAVGYAPKDMTAEIA